MTTHWADIDLLSVSSLEAPVFKREWFTKVVNDYLMKFREQREAGVTPKSSSQLNGLAGQLISFKQLLDSGALSKEEFQAAKVRLLGVKSSNDDGIIKPRRPKSDSNDNSQDLGGHGIGV